MANNVPKDIGKIIKRRVFAQAETYGYSGRSRSENSVFMDNLIKNSQIGGVLREYMPEGNIRTYIKDGVLNAYTKKLSRNIQQKYLPKTIVHDIYGVDSEVIDKKYNLCLCCKDGKELFVISAGTVLKWETALRKGLEYIAGLPGATKYDKKISICLKLAVVNNSISSSDKSALREQLAWIRVDAFFCE